MLALRRAPGARSSTQVFDGPAAPRRQGAEDTADVALLLGSTVGAQPPPSSAEPVSVSLIRLLANPDRYEGRLVRVIGVFHFGMEESVLYLHREDEELLNANNAVWVSPKAGSREQDYKELSGAFVIVEGRFTAKAHGHLGAFPGELQSVSRLQKLRTRADFAKERTESR